MTRTCNNLYILISKCILRYDGVDFFEILIAKSGPTMMDFVKGNWEAILPSYE